MAANYLLVSLLFLISTLSVFSLSSSSSSPIIPIRSEYEVSLLYEGWLIKQNKSYKDPFEKKMRYEIFKDNLKYIDEHNAGNHTFTLALNVFADITVEEYRSTYLATLPPPQGLDTLDNNESNETAADLFHFNETPVAVPDSIDWRDFGAVLPVKNQSSCFSCWAFAAVATIEAINQIITGQLTPLSVQQLVDCECKSCKSCKRHSHKAFEYIIKNGGIDSEQDYPYTAVYKKCDTSKENNKVVTIDGYKWVPATDENALKTRVAKQPVATSIEAYERPFQLYGTGIFTKDCGMKLDHVVTLIGYGIEGSTDYWLIKNSWGDAWGEAGYMKLERNVNTAFGKCGVAIKPIYPVKNKHVVTQNFLSPLFHL